MKRCEFITLVGGAVAWPLAARAQPAPALPVIGWLGASSAESWRDRLADTREGLKEQGFASDRTSSSNTGGRTTTMSASRNWPLILCAGA